MATHEEKVRVSIEADGTGVSDELSLLERNAKRASDAAKGVERGYNNSLKAAQKAANQEKRLWEKSQKDVEQMEREGLERRGKMRDDAYAKMQQAEKNRLIQLAQDIRVKQIQSGIDPGMKISGFGGTKDGFSKTSGMGGGSRWIGDTINSLTGTSGAVMRVNALAHGMKITAGAAGGIIAVGTILAASLHKVSEAAAEARKETDEINKSFAKTAIASQTAFSPDSINEARDAIGDTLKQLETRQAKLMGATFGNSAHQGFKLFGQDMAAWWNAPLAGPVKAGNQQRAIVEQQIKVEKSLQALMVKRAGSLAQGETRIAQAQFEGNPFEAKRVQLDVAHEQFAAMSAVKSVSQQVRDEEEERYQIAQDTVDREEDLASKRYLNARTLAGINLMDGSVDAKKVSTMMTEIEQSKELLASGNLDMQQTRETLILMDKQKASLKDFNREFAIRVLTARHAVFSSGIGAQSSIARLTMNPDAASRAALIGQVTVAQDALRLAGQRVVQEHKSEESIDAQKTAAYELAKAQSDVAFFDKELARTRRVELDLSKSETSSMRLRNLGYEMAAQLTESRARSAADAAEFERQGKHEMAEQVQLKQELNESSQLTTKWLNPDGTRRNPADVHAEERAMRTRAGRVERFLTQIKRDNGLTDVDRDMRGNILSGKDRITGQRRGVFIPHKARPAEETKAAGISNQIINGLTEFFKDKTLIATRK